jgi:hypothetical protein
MRILLTGAGGNIGRGLSPRLLEAGHQLVLSDVARPSWLDEYPGLEFHQLDVQIGVGLDRAAAGCDLIVHLPAWHGIHTRERSEADFWRLNVDGTFWVLQAAKANGIGRFLFMSSQAWHGHYDKYGFTKRIGEELLAYQHAQTGLSYVAIRPAALTPWSANWPEKYGRRLLYGGVDREDVLDSIVLSVAYLEHAESAALIVDALHPNPFTADQLEGWEDDPLAAVERIFPGSREIVERYDLDVSERPKLTTDAGWAEIGFSPSRHFGTFVEEARGLDPEEARRRGSDY